MENKFENFKKSMKNKSITVIGMGVSNMPLINLLIECGACLSVRDKKTIEEIGDEAIKLQSKGVKLILGEEYLDNIEEDVVFKTPGLLITNEKLQKALRNGKTITSEMEVFFDVCPCKIIAVTGSDGKTTTTTLIYEMLKKQGYTCHLGGNIGKPLLCETDKIKEDDIAIVELSSFQLQTMNKSPEIAVVTNLSPNHLDKHKNMEEYVEAKKNIFKYQRKTDKVVLNYDNEITRGFEKEVNGNLLFFSRNNKPENGVYLKENKIYYNEKFILNAEDIVIPGIHNVENYMTAIAAVIDICSVEKIVETAKTFGGVPHRIEFIKKVNGVSYYNDSIASSPTRAKAGLYSFNQKVILIAGGYDKKIPFDDFGNDICKRVKCLILCGHTAPLIKTAVLNSKEYKENEPYIIDAVDMRDCVLKAKDFAKDGDVVMLSPACASFDFYKNFEERGNIFSDIVRGLV